MQRFLWTFLNTFEAENTFRSIHSIPSVICHINIHRTNFFALTAGDTFVLVIFNPYQRKITGRF